MYTQLLLIALWASSFFQSLNASVDLNFKNKEIQDIADRLLMYTMSVRLRVGSCQWKLVVEETGRLTTMLVSFNNLVEYTQKNKPSCLTPYVQSVYNLTSTDIFSQMKACLPSKIVTKELGATILDLLSDVFDQLKTIDLELTNILDETDKAIEIALANWCIPGSVYAFCMGSGQNILYDYSQTLLCLIRSNEDLAFQVETCIQSIGECHKSDGGSN